MSYFPPFTFLGREVNFGTDSVTNELWLDHLGTQNKMPFSKFPRTGPTKTAWFFGLMVQFIKTPISCRRALKAHVWPNHSYHPKVMSIKHIHPRKTIHDNGKTTIWRFISCLKLVIFFIVMLVFRGVMSSLDYPKVCFCAPKHDLWGKKIDHEKPNLPVSETVA